MRELLNLLEDNVSATRDYATDKLLKKGLKALEKTPSGRSSGDSGKADVGGKYKSLNFTPPGSVKAAAKMGLDMRRLREKLAQDGKIGKSESLGGTDIGVARALQLSKGTAITPRAVRRMSSLHRS